MAPGTYERCTEVPPFARAYIICRTHRRCSLSPIPTFPDLRPQSTPWLSRCSVAQGSFRPTTDFTAAAAPRNSSTCWFCSGTRREWCAPADEHIPSLPLFPSRAASEYTCGHSPLGGGGGGRRRRPPAPPSKPQRTRQRPQKVCGRVRHPFCAPLYVRNGPRQKKV